MSMVLLSRSLRRSSDDEKNQAQHKKVAQILSILYERWRVFVLFFFISFFFLYTCCEYRTLRTGCLVYAQQSCSGGYVCGGSDSLGGGYRRVIAQLFYHYVVMSIEALTHNSR